MYVPKLVKRHEYQNFTQINSPTGRRYEYNGLSSPSVTTILSATADKSFLDEWKKRIGTQQANEITQMAAGRGTIMHHCLEYRMAGLPDPEGDAPVRVMGRRMADVMQTNAWPNINEVWGIEVSLAYPGLWAGNTDLVGIHNGDPAIIDYKNARKPKKREYIEDYTLQCAAYALAHNHMYGTSINKAVICVCVYNDSTHEIAYQEFIIEGDDFKRAVDMWLNRVEQYYQKIN